MDIGKVIHGILQVTKVAEEISTDLAGRPQLDRWSNGRAVWKVVVRRQVLWRRRMSDQKGRDHDEEDDDGEGNENDQSWVQAHERVDRQKGKRMSGFPPPEETNKSILEDVNDANSVRSPSEGLPPISHVRGELSLS